MHESRDMRLAWFEKCLLELSQYIKILNIDSVAFPYGIGCGLAGGDYYRVLEQWSKSIVQKVYIVKMK